MNLHCALLESTEKQENHQDHGNQGKGRETPVAVAWAGIAQPPPTSASTRRISSSASNTGRSFRRYFLRRPYPQYGGWAAAARRAFGRPCLRKSGSTNKAWANLRHLRGSWGN